MNNSGFIPRWIIILLVVVFVLRIPSFFEPYSYGDEMIYLTLGEAMRQGVALYRDIHDNKPPLLYIFAAIAGNLFWFKMILAVWHLATIYIFWKLSIVLFKDNKTAQRVCTIIFALLTTIPLLEGNIVNSEIFMVGPTILAFLLLLTLKLNTKNLLIAGSLFSIAALFKIPAAFDFPVIFIYWLITEKKLELGRIINFFKKSFPLVLGFAVPILLTFVWFYTQSSFREYLIAAFLQNFGYLSSFRPGDQEKSFLVRNGPLLVRGLVVAIAAFAVYVHRKKLSNEFILATLWLFFSLFAVTLSERPYPHYLIQAVAPFSILFAILVSKITKEQVYAIIPLFFAFFVPVYYNFWHYPTASYYIRFIRLVTGSMSKDEYLNSYGSQVPRNYKIAKFVSSMTKPNERIFVWGDGSPIYALSKRIPSGKYAADYHIKDFSNNGEVMTHLYKNMPNIIIIHKDSNPFPSLTYFVRRNYGLTNTIDGSEIWKLLNPKVRSIFTF